MTTLGYDCAFDPRPDPKAAYTAGYRFVIRYLYDPAATPTKPGKAITAAEVQALHAANLAILLVWETTAGRATQGYGAGVADRKSAEQIAHTLGYPLGCPIFYAVDSNVAPSAVSEYFRGVNVTHVYPTGVYGSEQIVDAQLAKYLWQTEAWSGTKVSDLADLYQRVKPTLAMSGGYDENVLLHDTLPMWTPEPVGPLPLWYRRVLKVGSVGRDVAALKRRLVALGYKHIARRGPSALVYGTGVHKAVTAFQRRENLPTTGVVDAATARRLRRP